ncbi:hypothetical protein J4207_05420 [Candidatus Woesearchaeota archaeon]|nr:hypothetical protein [Candidatus Woesearchaeota archaeon]
MGLHIIREIGWGTAESTLVEMERSVVETGSPLPSGGGVSHHTKIHHSND